MSDNSKYKVKDELLRYLKNEMEPEERNRFERNLERDPFELEAMEGFAEYSWNEIGHDLNYLVGKFTKRKSRRLVFILSTAASLLILVVASFLFLKQDKSDLEVVQKVLEEQVVVKEDTIRMADEIVVDDEEDALEDQQEATEQEFDAVDVAEEKNKIAQPKLSTSKSEEINVGEVAANLKRRIEQPNVKGVEIPEPELASEAKESMSLKVEETGKSSPQIMIRGMSSTSNKKSNWVIGKVVDEETGGPLPGVSIVVEGTGNGTVSDATGFYKLELPDTATYNLVASFVGMNTISFTSKEPYKELIMIPSDLALEEVVMVGYGTSKKKDELPDSLINRRKVEPEIGWDAYREYLKTSVIYPGDSTATGKREVVRLDFIVYADGKVGSFNILKSPGESYSNEAIRLIEAGGIWIPEIKDGNTISKKVELRIVFRPEE